MTITKIITYIITVSMIGVILWAQGQVSIFDSPIPKLPWGCCLTSWPLCWFYAF